MPRGRGRGRTTPSRRKVPAPHAYLGPTLHLPCTPRQREGSTACPVLTRAPSPAGTGRSPCTYPVPTPYLPCTYPAPNPGRAACQHPPGGRRRAGGRMGGRGEVGRKRTFRFLFFFLLRFLFCQTVCTSSTCGRVGMTLVLHMFSLSHLPQRSHNRRGRKRA